MTPERNSGWSANGTPRITACSLCVDRPIKASQVITLHNGMGIIRSHGHEPTSHYWDLVSNTGDLVGEFVIGLKYSDNEDAKIPWIRNSLIHPAFRGHGYGRLAMKALVKHYGILRSDIEGSTSDHAEKAWQAIGAKRLNPRKRTHLDKSDYVLGASQVRERGVLSKMRPSQRSAKSVVESENFLPRKCRVTFKEIAADSEAYQLLKSGGKGKDSGRFIVVQPGEPLDMSKSYCLTDGSAYLWLDFDSSGKVTGATRYGNSGDVEPLLNYLGDFVSEHDDDYWNLIDDEGEEMSTRESARLKRAQLLVGKLLETPVSTNPKNQPPGDDGSADPSGMSAGSIHTVGNDKFVLVNGIVRGGSTTFFWSPPDLGGDNHLYYYGENPDDPSDGMVMLPPWDNAYELETEPTPTGEMYGGEIPADLNSRTPDWRDANDPDCESDDDDEEEVDESAAKLVSKLVDKR